MYLLHSKVLCEVPSNHQSSHIVWESIVKAGTLPVILHCQMITRWFA